MLPLAEANALLLKHRSAGPSAAGPAQVPRQVMQYWDRQPPEQVRRLLDRNASLCREAGAAHTVFDDARARAYIAERAEPMVLEAYDIAVHPAMKCDVFRLCHLFHTGGYYVDADIVLKRNLGELLALPGGLVAFQWDSRGIDNLCNWLIGARPGHPVMRSALDATARNVIAACRADPQAALKNILGVSGPGIFTRGVAAGLQALRDSGADAGDVNLQTVSRAHQLIQLGPAYLNQPLGYKADARHWQAAATSPSSDAVPNEPSAPPPQAPAPAEGWLARLRRRLG